MSSVCWVGFVDNNKNREYRQPHTSNQPASLNCVSFRYKSVKAKQNPSFQRTQSESEQLCRSTEIMSFMWLTHIIELLSLTHTQSIYRQGPEKIRCSQSDTGPSQSVRETNMRPAQLCVLPRAWCQDRCCRGSGLLSGPPALCPRATSWNTHWAQSHSPTVLSLHTTAPLRRD